MPHRPEVVLDGLVFPECPRWHDGRLWFSDMHAHRVQSVDLAGQATMVADTDRAPSGLGFLPDGSLLITGMRACVVWRLVGGELRLHADLRHLGYDFLNDLVVDDQGRAYLGCRRHRTEGEPPPEEHLALIGPDGTIEILDVEVTSPNGMVISADGATLIVAETLVDRLAAFDRQPDGRLTNRRVFAELTTSFPDGICLDAEGAVWVGTAVSGECLRIAEGGEVLERFDLGGRWPVAVMLGGPEGTTLFICSADTTLAGLAAAKQAAIDHPDDRVGHARLHSRGAIERVEVDVPGAGWP